MTASVSATTELRGRPPQLRTGALAAARADLALVCAALSRGARRTNQGRAQPVQAKLKLIRTVAAQFSSINQAVHNIPDVIGHLLTGSTVAEYLRCRSHQRLGGECELAFYDM
jgi:hypothetical protein